MTLPEDRTSSSTVDQHVADHNTLHDFYNDHVDSPIVNVADYGAASAASFATNTTAFAAAVAVVETAGGGTIYIPPGFYNGEMLFTANVALEVIGYGAFIYGASGGYCIKADRTHGASAQMLTFRGLHLKGNADMTTVGLWVLDCDRVSFNDGYIERCSVGVKYENAGTDVGVESNRLDHTTATNCTIGIDFVLSPGFASVGSFMQTQFHDVDIDNCPTGLRLPTGANVFRRCDFTVNFWVPDAGIAVDCDADMFQVRAVWKAEAHGAITTTATGVKVRVNSTNWEDADITLGIAAVVPVTLDTTTASAVPTFVWREGAEFKSASTVLAPASIMTFNGQVRANQGMATRYLTGSGKATTSDADFTGGAQNGLYGVLNDSAAGGKQRLAVRVGGVWRYTELVATIYDFRGAGTPEAAVTAPVGSTYNRTDGGAGTSFYVKESGTGDTGWVAK